MFIGYMAYKRVWFKGEVILKNYASSLSRQITCFVYACRRK